MELQRRSGPVLMQRANTTPRPPRPIHGATPARSPGKETIPIHYPFGGFSETYAFSRQPPGTTRELQNMRGINSVNGRIQGASRSGLGDYIAGALQVTAASKVADMARIVTSNNLLTYAERTSGVGADDFQIESPGHSFGVWLAVDPFDNIYVLDGTFGVTKWNSDGKKIQEIPAPVDLVGLDMRMRALAVDDFGNIYMGVGNGTEMFVTSTQAIQDRSRIWAFRQMRDGTYELAWEKETNTGPDSVGVNRYVECLVFKNGNLYALQRATHSAALHLLAIYRGVSIFATPADDLFIVDDDSAANPNSGLFGTPVAEGKPVSMAVRNDGVIYVCGRDDANTSVDANGQWLAAFDPSEPFGSQRKWVLNRASALGAVGMGVAIGDTDAGGDQFLFTCGVKGTGLNEIAMYLDTGAASLTTSGFGTWDVSHSSAQAINVNHDGPLQLAVDEDFNVYLPWNGGTTAAQPCVTEFGNAAGAEIFSYNASAPDIGPIAVQLPRRLKPTYQAASPPDCHEIAYLAHDSVTLTNFIATWINTVTVTQTGTALRTHKTLAVSGGHVREFTTSAVNTITGGDSALDSGAPYVQSAVLFDRVYFTDGINYAVYNATDDVVEDWQAETEQRVPPRCRLIESWRGRLVLARDAENANQFHMSAVGNPDDWNPFPLVRLVTQAIRGSLSKAGLVPDIVNCLIPYSDDFLYFGGDRQIWRLTGDPLQGGQFDLVTDETGISFGRPYVKDPLGNLYFFGSRGGVYVMSPSGPPRRITLGAIERTMQNVDLGTFYIRLVWNYRDEGLHVFQCPYGAGGTIVDHWFWEAKTNSWNNPDRFGAAGSTFVQPTSVFQMDGDTQTDRVILLGGEDSRIRSWDENAKRDGVGANGVEIDSFVTIGPIAPADSEYEYMFDGFQATLARDLDGCSFEFFADDEPDVFENLVLSGSLHSGYNSPRLEGFTGRVCYLRLRNASPSQRFAIESMSIDVARGSRTRMGHV